MANTLQTSVEQLQRELKGIREELRVLKDDRLKGVRETEVAQRLKSPFAQFEFVDVTFGSTAHQDTEIKHSLSASDPHAIRVIPLEWQFASVPSDPVCLYRNIASTSRPWGPGYLILRCNLASAKARLLLIAEAQ